MEVTWVIFALFLIGFYWYTLYPLFDQRSALEMSVRFNRGEALEQFIYKKLSIYTNIKDLDFEYQMGKISLQDYQAMRLECKKEASAVLVALDSFHYSNDALKEVEQRIMQSLQSQSTAVFCPACNAKNEPDTKICQKCNQPIAHQNCPACGQLVLKGEAFCNHCGHCLDATRKKDN